MSDWLKNLKPGDKVYLVRRGWRCSGIIGTVTRLTKTQILVKPHGLKIEERFRKKDGFIFARTAWSYYRIEELTRENIAEIQVSKLQRKAKRLRDKLAIPDTKRELVRFIRALKPFV